jgi:nitrogen fixation/metabolism regulation signal transduction histidine kinase
LSSQSAEIEAGQQAMLMTLFGVLLLLSVAVGLAGIVVTHKVAGPIYKMTRQFHDVADGHWNMPSPLRKGDELGDFFREFEDMVRALRTQREKEMEILAELKERMGDMTDEQKKTYDQLHREMERALHG